MSWVTILENVAAVLGLFALAWALGLGGTREQLKTAEAARTLAEQLSGFTAGRAWLSTVGDAALVEGAANDVALIRRHGAAYVTRRLLLPLSPAIEDASVIVPTGERTPRAVRVTLANAAEARDLAATLGAAAHG